MCFKKTIQFFNEFMCYCTTFDIFRELIDQLKVHYLESQERLKKREQLKVKHQL
jgi:hypothetical protein